LKLRVACEMKPVEAQNLCKSYTDPEVLVESIGAALETGS